MYSIIEILLINFIWTCHCNITPHVSEHKSSSEAAMELDGRQHHGAIPAFAPRVEENIPSLNVIETPSINQQKTQNDGSKRQ